MVKIVDARGLSCPQPVIETKAALKEMGEDGVKVLTDDEIAVKNLLKLGDFMNLQTSLIQLGDKDFEIIFSAVGENCALENKPVEGGKQDLQSGCVAVIDSERMGEGDEELGKILMKGFLYALTQLEEFPETILFYNGGAKLSVEGSESLDDLKLLESYGTEILTCGTCLNYYGLSERLAVGAVTNMYEIAERMTSARLIVRP